MPKVRDVAVATGRSRETNAVSGARLASDGAHPRIKNPARPEATGPRPTLNDRGVV